MILHIIDFGIKDARPRCHRPHLVHSVLLFIGSYYILHASTTINNESVYGSVGLTECQWWSSRDPHSDAESVSFSFDSFFSEFNCSESNCKWNNITPTRIAGAFAEFSTTSTYSVCWFSPIEVVLPKQLLVMEWRPVVEYESCQKRSEILELGVGQFRSQLSEVNRRDGMLPRLH